MPSFDEESEDLEALLDAYEMATGERLVEEDAGEAPDFTCRRENGSLIGVELTQIRRSPNQAWMDSVIKRDDEMDAGKASEELERILLQKAEKAKKYRLPNIILMIANREANFQFLVNLASTIPISDLKSFGFEEIWLADFQGRTQGAHREVVLFGLYPEIHRKKSVRSVFDQKPYG